MTDLLALQDDCLISITDHRPLPAQSLRALPPWRAVLIARIANLAGITTTDDGHDLDEIVLEAQIVGGSGALEQ